MPEPKRSEFLASDTRKFYGMLQLLIEAELAAEKDLDVSTLSHEANVSESTIRRILKGRANGKMRVRTLFRILHALDYDVIIDRIPIYEPESEPTED